MKRTLVCLLLAALACAPARAHESLDEVAAWLAGTHRDGNRLASQEQAATEAAWEKLRGARLAPMDEFARMHFAQERAHCDTLFYPFSGPDILNALGLFPACRRYILFGLEPVGAVPPLERLDAEHRAQVLADMDKAQQYILRRNFFVTQYMSTELNTPNLKGVLPILLAMLARMDYRLVNTEYADLDGHVPASPGDRPRIVYVRFQAQGGGPIQELMYASFDASDDGLRRRPGFLQAIAPIDPTVTLLKAASYLLHDASFSRIRALILERSQVVVQDDSGVPYAELLAHGFCVELYGDYVQTIPQFRYRFQKDLAEAYRRLPERAPLPFAWSYAWRPSEEALQIARKANHPGACPP